MYLKTVRGGPKLIKENLNFIMQKEVSNFVGKSLANMSHMTFFPESLNFLKMV